MKKILLLCAAGMSTSMLVRKMEQAAEAKNIEVTIDAFGVNMLNEKLPEYDVVMIGPQIRYQKATIEKVVTEQGKKVDVIDSIAYGTMNGEKVLNSALAMIS